MFVMLPVAAGALILVYVLFFLQPTTAAQRAEEDRKLHERMARFASRGSASSSHEVAPDPAAAGPAPSPEPPGAGASRAPEPASAEQTSSEAEPASAPAETSAAESEDAETPEDPERPPAEAAETEQAKA